MVGIIGKSFAKRYWLFGVVLVVGMALAGLQRSLPLMASLSDMPPAPVLVRNATVVAQGTQLEWAAAQEGTRPLGRYIIERSSDGGHQFKAIARVEPWALRFVDAEGRRGDVYRIVAEDTGKPPQRSAASEHLVALPAQPGSTVVVAPATPRAVLGDATALAQAVTPDAKAAILEQSLSQVFIDLDKTLAARKNDLARSQLGVLQNYQQQVLRLWAQLAGSQKAALAHMCEERMGVFEANLHALPERDQLDGMLVEAGCDAIREGAQ